MMKQSSSPIHPSQKTIGILRTALAAAALITACLQTATAAPGDRDTNFNVTLNGNQYSFAAVQPDGMILLCGAFSSVNGTNRHHAARLNPLDGSLDPSFDPDLGPDVTRYPFSLAVQPDGRILVGGNILSVGGATVRYLARLNTNGVLDTNFNFSPISSNAINAVACNSDGTVLVAGAFTYTGGSSNLARLSPSGTFDLSFSGRASSVDSIAIQTNGQILAGQIATACVGRFNTNGTRDTNFTSSFTNKIYAIALQADGKILFSRDTHPSSIFRLNADGTFDTNFQANVDGYIRSIAIQADQKILIGGDFPHINGTSHPYLARLNTNGALDSTFASTLPFLNVNTIALQADGKALVAYANPPYFARLLNDPATQSLSVPDPTRVLWTRGGSSPEATTTTFEVSTDSGNTWTLLGAGTRVSGGWELTGLTLSGTGQIRARAQVPGGGVAFGGSVGGCSFGLVEKITSFSNLPPILHIQAAATGVTLLWSTNFSTWVAQANWFLSDPNSWVDLTNVPVTNDTTFSIGIPATNAARFFRLRSP